MPKSLQELSDRLDIQDLQAAYSHAIDTRDFDALDRVFTPDAYIDYTAFGGSAGGLAETKAFLAKALAMFGGFQHMVATSQVKLSGNRATAKTICWNPMVVKRAGGEEHVFFCGLWYHDEYLRTLDGWRMTRRSEEKSFTHNMPAEFLNPEAAMKKRAPASAKSAAKKPAAKAKAIAKKAPPRAAKKPAAKNRKK
jgi:ketosteroid isomerase-like protein